MPYTVELFNNVRVEEYATGWILRMTFPQGNFKFYAHPQGEEDVVIYIGHGNVTMEIKSAIRQWADKRGIKRVFWGRDKLISKRKNV